MYIYFILYLNIRYKYAINYNSIDMMYNKIFVKINYVDTNSKSTIL